MELKRLIKLANRKYPDEMEPLICWAELIMKDEMEKFRENDRKDLDIEAGK